MAAVRQKSNASRTMLHRAWRILLVAGLLGLASPSPWCAEAPPVVSAASALLMDCETGKVLLAKGARQRRPVASTTKIMTALLIMESGRLKNEVTISENALKTKCGSLWVDAGQKMPMADLLKAILLNSSNDGCVAAAEAVAGSEAKFAALMNRRARRIGAHDTHFADSNGLYLPDHYSTAYDLALITRQALKHPLVSQLVATKTLVIPWPGKPWGRVLHNRNKLLWMLEGADGVKTGYVKESGKCLVASATRGGWQLLAVVLNSEDVWQDASRLLEYGFARFRMVRAARKGQVIGTAPLVGGRAERVKLVAADPIGVVVKREDVRRCRFYNTIRPPLRAPLEKGERVGDGQLWLGGRVVSQAGLLAAQAVELSWFLTVWLWTKRLLALAAAIFLAGLGIRTCAKRARAVRAQRRGG